jgi:hypothetical protein
MRWILNRFTYANVMATFAVFLGLTGTAVAAVAVANNSVGSPQIINGSIQSVDIGNGQVTGADVAEGTLAKVPAAVNADKLGGAPASAYSRLVANQAANFTGYFMPTVAGYGAYGLQCDTDGLHWADNLATLGTGARSIKAMSWSDGPYTASETDVLEYLWDGTGAGFGTSVAHGKRFFGDAYIQNAAGTKRLHVEAWGRGFDDGDIGTTGDCWASVEAWILK